MGKRENRGCIQRSVFVSTFFYADTNELRKPHPYWQTNKKRI